MFKYPEVSAWVDTDGQEHEQAVKSIIQALDLSRLSRGGLDFATGFVEALLEKDIVDADFEVPFPVAKLWRHLVTQTQNEYRLKGHHNLAIGFPLLQTTSEARPTPIFLWQIQAEKQLDSAETWKIKHDGNSRLNPALVNILPSTVLEELQTMFTGARKTSTSLFEQVAALFNTLGFQVEETWKNLSQVEPTSVTKLLKSAVIGIFPPLWLLRPKTQWQPTLPQTPNHTQGLSTLHPHQASAFQNILQHPFNIVEGMSGTGKTYLLAHTLSNALSNEKRCLVVADYISPLRQLQRVLEKQGIQQLHFLLKNTDQDLKLLFELVKAVAQNTKSVKFEPETFQLLLNRCERGKEKLNQYYELIEKTLLGKYTWTEVVGNFMLNNRIAGKEYLDSHLCEQDFEFSAAEYRQLLEVLQKSQTLYSQELGLKHPLKRLHKTIYTDKTQQEGLAFAQQTIGNLLQKAYQLLQRYSNKISNYKAKLRTYYEHHHEQFNTKSLHLLEQIADAQLKYGEEFEKVSAISLYGAFSKRHKEIVAAQEDILMQFKSFKKNFEQHQFFNFTFYDTNSITKLNAEIQRFRESLQNWGKEIPSQLQEEIKRLSENTVLVDLDFQEQIQELEYAQDLLIEEVNEANLFRKGIEKKILTIPKRQKYLESLIEQLESTHFHLKDFDLYYEWERHWLLCTDNERSIIRALIKARPPVWEAAFKSWYLYYFLSKNYNQNLVSPSDDAVTDYSLDYQVLRPMLLRQIEATWIKLRDVHFKALKKNNKEGYQTITTRKWDTSEKSAHLLPIWSSCFDAITHTTPVLLATTSVAYELLSNHETPRFDYLFIEAAHTASVAQWLPLFPLANQVVLLTNPSLGHSDLEALTPWHPVKSCLKSYFGKSLGIMPFQAAIYQSIDHTSRFSTPHLQLKQVDGRYLEREGINEAEVEEVIRLLNEIKSPNERTYPSVGIVCFTYPQRNLIVEYLENVKLGKGKTLLESLERHGLGVFHAEELSAQTYDVLIISNTFGTVDVLGNLPKALATLETEVGTSWINTVLACAQNQVFVVNSIPMDRVEEWVNFPKSKGCYRWGNFILYAQAVENEYDDTTQHLILDNLKKHHTPPSSIFLEEVKAALKAYFDPDRIVEHTLQHEHPIALGITSNKTEALISLQYEGKQFQHQRTDYCWEYEYQQQLTEEEINTLPLWSVNWWKNPKQEARRLASTIIKWLK